MLINGFVGTGKGAGARAVTVKAGASAFAVAEAPSDARHEVRRLQEAAPHPAALTTFALLRTQEQQTMKCHD